MNNTLAEHQLNHLIGETLLQPEDAKAYLFTQKLTELFPDQAVMQGFESSFDLNDFIADGCCAAEFQPGMFHHQVTYFGGLGEELSVTPRNALYEISWQGHHLQVVVLSWVVSQCDAQHYWIIAESLAIAQEFYQCVCEWSSEVRGEVLVFDGGAWYKDERLFRSIKNSTFDNLILARDLKEEIQEDFAQFFASREMYERYRIPWKRGVLLIGPPGNGKTHTVKALSNWLGVPCLYVKSFKRRYDTDQNSIRQVFQRARQTTPCLLILEDLDSLIDDRNRSFFLNELDGFAANTGVVVLATTNHPERLDPALINRPSRFDRKYYFNLPEAPEREAYICAWNGAIEPELQLCDDAVASTVAATEGFSFAYLKELFLSSLMRWISQHGAVAMDAVVTEQCVMLRGQMSAMEQIPPAETQRDEEEDD
jgi:hypothetical protein